MTETLLNPTPASPNNQPKNIFKFGSLHSGKTVVMVLIAIVGAVFLIGGVFLAYRLSQSDQDVRQQASTATGTATVNIAPTSAQLNTNGSQSFTVSFNPQNNIISGISVRLQYAITNNQPLIAPDKPVAIVTQSDQNWNCPVINIESIATLGTIDVGCIYLATTGFTGQSDVPLFTVNITAGSSATTNPLTLMFDPTKTVITRKSDNQDVAAIPQSTANITIVGSPTATPTPTQTPNPTPTPTSNPSTGTNPTPTNIPLPKTTNTPTPTPNLLTCNQTCLANRDCERGLSCIDGQCLSEQCPADITCACQDYNLATATNTTDLPDSGSISQTILTLLVGSMLLVGSSGVLLAQLGRKE